MKTYPLFNRIKRASARALAGAAALCMAASLVVLPGCGSGSGTGTTTASDSNLAIGLTDAQGDFISYTVDVKSITLTKENGAVVETVPVKTTVDFAQYVDLTEFFTAATIPNGAYSSMKMVLDYTNANIQVEGTDGKAVKVASIVDGKGTPLTTLEVTVNLEGRNKLKVAPGQLQNMTIDFDLAQSNKVTFAGNVPTLTVEPVVLIDLEHKKPKLHRVRGGLKDVDVANSTFNVILRPFAHALKDDDKNDRFGTMQVVTTTDTVFEINGTTYDQSTGIKTLNTMTQFTAIVAIGNLKFNPRRFEAREVHAGSSVMGGTLDGIVGSVIKRVGNTLTVKGATLIRKDGSMVFNDEVSVTLANSTTVTRQPDDHDKGKKSDMTTAYKIVDISVGQRVAIAGTVTDASANSLALDATNGHVRLLVTVVRGTVKTANPLVVDVQTIDGRKVSLFDFSGTSSDPTNYRVNTGALALTGVTASMPISVRGYVVPFGTANATVKDFDAITLVDVSDVPTAAVVKWDPPSANALGNPVGTTQLTLNLTGATVHELWRAGVTGNLADGMKIVPDDDEGMYWVKEGSGALQAYTTFADFAAGVQSRLTKSMNVQALAATGHYADGTNTLTSRFVTVEMK